LEDYELIAQELSDLGEKIRGLDHRLADVEKVNARLEDAALTTARALGEIARHWDAVYEAMRRAEKGNEDAGRDYGERDDAASGDGASNDAGQGGVMHSNPDD
jgi:hypothetical protein